MFCKVSEGSQTFIIRVMKWHVKRWMDGVLLTNDSVKCFSSISFSITIMIHSIGILSVIPYYQSSSTLKHQFFNWRSKQVLLLFACTCVLVFVGLLLLFYYFCFEPGYAFIWVFSLKYKFVFLSASFPPQTAHILTCPHARTSTKSVSQFSIVHSKPCSTIRLLCLYFLSKYTHI